MSYILTKKIYFLSGRVNVKTVSKRQNRSLQRIDRRNKSKQIRAKKREEVRSIVCLLHYLYTWWDG